MERQRSVYIKFLISFVAILTLLAFNRFVLKNSLQDRVYRVIALISNTWAMPEMPSENTYKLVADQSLKRENDLLRKQLDFEMRHELEVNEAKIIFIQRNALVSMVLIDKGLDDGLATGQAVIAGGGILVGKIEKVLKHSAWVLLVDDPRFTASVRLGDTKILGEHRGDLSGQASINLVSHTEKVDLGLTVATSGLDEFPEGLIVSAVESAGEGSNLFKDIKTKIYFDIAQGPLLFVVQ